MCRNTSTICKVQGKSASTIHDHVAGICGLWGVPMDAYTLPLRVVAGKHAQPRRKALR